MSNVQTFLYSELKSDFTPIIEYFNSKDIKVEIYLNPDTQTMKNISVKHSWKVDKYEYHYDEFLVYGFKNRKYFGSSYRTAMARNFGVPDNLKPVLDAIFTECVGRLPKKNVNFNPFAIKTMKQPQINCDFVD